MAANFWLSACDEPVSVAKACSVPTNTRANTAPSANIATRWKAPDRNGRAYLEANMGLYSSLGSSGIEAGTEGRSWWPSLPGKGSDTCSRRSDQSA